MGNSQHIAEPIKFSKLCLGMICVAMLLQLAHSPQACAIAPASTPELSLIMPRGMQRGKTQLLKFSGKRLDAAQEVFFYDEGISVVSVKSINSKQVDVTVEVSADCRLGEHVAQLRTEHGISDFRSVYVGAMEELEETEPNNDAATAKTIPLNRTINGTLLREDVDRFSFELKKGQRLSAEIEATRLGEFVDSVIEIFGPSGASLAVSDDTTLGGLDGFFTITAAENGVYTIVVSDSAFQGSGKSRYRLHVGDFPRPSTVMPAGGAPESEIELQTDAAIETTQIKTPASNPFREGVTLSDSAGVTPSPVPFRLSALKNFNLPEDAEQQSYKNPVAISLPIAINGRMNAKEHFYRFTAKKGQTWDIQAIAKQIGSPMDPLINIFNDKRKHLIGNDDNATRPDANVRFAVPEDGGYILRIRDYLKRVDQNFQYRVEFALATPSIQLSIKRNDRFSQRRQAVAVPQGGRFAAIVSVKKDMFNEAMELDHGALPDGVTMMAVPMRKGAAEMPVVFDADEDAHLTGGLVELSAHHHVDESKESAPAQIDLKSSFEIPAVFSLAQPNNTSYHSCAVDRLAVAVIKRLPYSIDIVPMKAPLVRNGSARVKVVVTRDEGFKETVRLQFPFRPPGLGTTYQIKVKPDQQEAFYPINANGGAQLGRWPFYVIANANVGGPAWTSSQLTKLEIAEPFVKCDADRVVGQRGQQLSVNVGIEQLVAFEGAATATIRGLPPHTKVNGPLQFNSKTESLTFELTTTDKTPFGNHKGLFVEVGIPANGEVSTGRAGNLQLQVQKPPQQKLANQTAVKGN